MRNRVSLPAIVLAISGLAVSPAHAAPKMYWADAGTGKIQRANLDGTNVEDIVTGRPSPRGVDLDLSNGKIYWGEAGGGLSGQIRRANLDGTEEEFVVDAGLRVSDIALDLVHEKVYWSAHFDNGGFVARSNLDGKNVEVIRETGIESIGALAIDPVGERLYWGLRDFPDGKIQRSALDGSGVEDFVVGDLYAIGGIAFDLRAGKVFWTDTSFDFVGKIQRASFDGSNVETLVSTGLTIVRGIALDVARGKMYWMNSGAGNQKAQRAALDGTNIEDLVSTGLELPSGVALAVPSGIPTLSLGGSLVMGLLMIACASVLIAKRRRAAVTCIQGLASCTVAGLLLATDANAQPVEVPSRIVEVAIDSGLVSCSPSAFGPMIVYSSVVSVDEATWIRLHFDDVELGGSVATTDAS